MVPSTTTQQQGAMPPVAETAFAGETATRRIPTQPIVLIVVLGVSAALLGAMRQIGKQAAISQEEAVVASEFRIDQTLTERYEKAMNVLTGAQDPLDVALLDFGRSPFAVRETALANGLQSTSPILPTAAVDSPELAAERARARTRAEIAAAASRLVLHSVMGGRKPLARIDDQTVAIGDEVGDHFTVAAIEGRTVTLEAGEDRFTLTMEASMDATAKKQK